MLFFEFFMLLICYKMFFYRRTDTRLNRIVQKKNKTKKKNYKKNKKYFLSGRTDGHTFNSSLLFGTSQKNILMNE